MKPKILISACLLGENCKYNGGNNLKDELVSKIYTLSKKFDLVAVCPEKLGGLSTPREPAEIVGAKVITKFSHTDVTQEFLNGAKICVQTALANDCKIAVFKEKSPSCGVNTIYDGTFSGKLKNGYGFTTKALIAEGIKIYSENEICKVI